MSALANYLEDEGIATVLVSLVRHQSDPACPPRVLWTPFELGRPMGPPLDAGFQLDVLTRLIGMLDAKSGPVLRLYPEDPPTLADNPEWKAPSLLPSGTLLDELRQLVPLHAEFMRRCGRTTVGVSGLSLHDAARYVEGFESGDGPSITGDGMSDMLRFRFAADDLKAHYLEAASRGVNEASARQLQEWLWRHTRLGRLLVAFAHASVGSSSKRRETVGSRFLVPRDWR